MKFLVLHDVLGVFGGAERVAHEVVKALAEVGDVVLATFNFSDSEYRRVMGEGLASGVSVFSLVKSLEKSPFTVYKRMLNMRRLLRGVGGGFDACFFSSLPHYVGFCGAEKKFVYVHFPEVDVEYSCSGLGRKAYLWLYRRFGKACFDGLFCNSFFTRRFLLDYSGVDAGVVYPPVDVDGFACSVPFVARKKQVVYVARFIPAKRHDLMKRLACLFPDYRFVSVGGFSGVYGDWFRRFCRDLPVNYSVEVNVANSRVKEVLGESRFAVHLMRGEHFGIAPVEALASGCVTFVPDFCGAAEIFPSVLQWRSFSDLVCKLRMFMEGNSGFVVPDLSFLKPENFRRSIVSGVLA